MYYPIISTTTTTNLLSSLLVLMAVSQQQQDLSSSSAPSSSSSSSSSSLKTATNTISTPPLPPFGLGNEISAATTTTTKQDCGMMIDGDVECATDKYGLRGLKWQKATSKKTSSVSSLTMISTPSSRLACRIPRQSILVAPAEQHQQDHFSTSSKHQRKEVQRKKDIESLMQQLYSLLSASSSSTSTLLSEQKQEAVHPHEESLDVMGQYRDYIASLPNYDDVSLATIGTNWERHQLHRLRHTPTISKIERLQKEKLSIIDRLVVKDDAEALSTKKQEEENLNRARWAYDLVSSRCLTGPFGQHGNLRASVGAWILSALISVWPFLLLLQEQQEVSSSYYHNSGPLWEGAPTSFLLTIPTTVPLLISTIALVANVLKLATNPPEVAMVPWVDMANHQSGGKSAKYARTMRFEYNLRCDTIEWKESLATSAGGTSRSQSTDHDRDYNDDDQWVTYDYGGESGVTNDKLLAVYGFVEENNPNDRFTIQNGMAGGDHQHLVVLGRNGKILSKGYQDKKNLPPDTTGMASLIEAVVRARVNLETAATTSIDPDDPVDVARAELASTWRTEKLRLIDEFLSVHSSGLS